MSSVECEWTASCTYSLFQLSLWKPVSWAQERLPRPSWQVGTNHQSSLIFSLTLPTTSLCCLVTLSHPFALEWKVSLALLPVLRQVLFSQIPDRILPRKVLLAKQQQQKRIGSNSCYFQPFWKTKRLKIAANGQRRQESFSISMKMPIVATWGRDGRNDE